MQIMNFFKTIKYFLTKNAHFFDTNAYFLITNSFFFRIIVDFFVLIAYFFTTIVHFSKLIDYFPVDNSQNPDDRQKTNSIRSSHPAHPFAVRHICKPTRANSPTEGLQKSLSAHPAPSHHDRAALQLESLIKFDDRLTEK